MKCSRRRAAAAVPPAILLEGSGAASGDRLRTLGGAGLPSLLRRIAAGAVLLLAGLVGGMLMGEAQTSGRAHVAGACIALGRSLERELLSPPAVDAVLHDLVSGRAPFRASFPLTATQFRIQCAEISRASFRIDPARSGGGATTAAR